MERPDLSNIDPLVVAYIEALEARLERTSSASQAQAELHDTPPPVPSEPPTTIGLISATANGDAKRTLRHLYTRQRRGGMGVFDLDTPEDSPPTILSLADADQSLLLITSLGRAFRLPVNSLPESDPRARGRAFGGKFILQDGETLAAIVPVLAQGYLLLLSQTGMLRSLRHHIFGEYMKPGTALYDYKSFGPVASASWSPGECDVFIATRTGRAIRFSDKQIPPQGILGIRLNEGDQAVAVTYVYPDSKVFLCGADGKGIQRSMETFSSNKAPGSGGKNAFATDHLLSALNADEVEDIFIISRLSKIIRFPLVEVPVKEGVVQGVNCMSFRADEASAVTANLRHSALLLQ